MKHITYNKLNILEALFFVVLFYVLCFMFRDPVFGATLYLMPQSQTVYEDESFIVEVRLDSEGEEINAVSAGLLFPDSLEVIDFSEGNSILTLWPEKPISVQDKLSFIGGVPKGFVGNGLILKITFKLAPDQNSLFDGEQKKKIKVRFTDDSKVLLNDGEASMAELTLLEGNYEVVKKPNNFCLISSKTHPNQDKWYNKNSLHLHWDLKEEASYSYILSYDPLAKPDEVPDKPEGELIWMGDMRYDDLEDGIYYFHLIEGIKDEKEKIVFGPQASFRVMIDSTEPEDFHLEVSQEPSVFEGKYFLTFFTEDKTSGLDHYEVLETDRRGYKYGTKEKATWQAGESPYLLDDQTLHSKILVKAKDKAGNEKIVEIPPKVKPFPWQVAVVILIEIGLIFYLIRKLKFKRKLKF